jgi:hypothetical protein
MIREGGRDGSTVVTRTAAARDDMGWSPGRVRQYGSSHVALATRISEELIHAEIRGPAES